MPRVFGYGSLVSSGPLEPATLPGWRRTWGVAMDNAVDLPGYKHYEEGDGTRPALMVAFLDVEPGEPGDELNGAVFEVEDLDGLDSRERNYAREEVETSVGPAWTFVGTRDGRERRDRGVAEARCVVQRAYLMRVLSGFGALGPDQLERFRETTAPLPCPLRDLVLVPHPR